MTPKEKALELFDAMHKVYDMHQYPDFTIDENDNQKNDELWQNNMELFSTIYKEFAKQCALIAADEILHLTSIRESWFNVKGKYEERFVLDQYWVEVKKEIEKL